MSRGRKTGLTQSLRERASGLLSKHGLVVTDLARTLLICAPGERIARVQEYAARLDASVGTVQMALHYLQSVGAVDLDARGRLGTYVQMLHYPLLWSLALNQPIVGVMPMPYSRRFEGLATGIRLQFAEQRLDLDLRFLRGSGQRLQLLAAKTGSWALVSRFAAETAEAHGFDVELVMSLGSETYMAQHVLLLRRDVTELEDGMRIGVDFQSTDHVYTVRAVSRGRLVELVNIDYSEGLKLVVSGAIDATVWTQEDIPADFETVAIRPLDLQSDTALARLGEAAVVVRSGDRAMVNLLQATLDLPALRQIQQEVVRLTRRPAY